MFEPFDRLGAESSGIEGTGVGLTLSKYLVERMGGTIDVHSQLGEGTTFTVDLPTADAPEVPGAGQEHPSTSRQRTRPCESCTSRTISPTSSWSNRS